MNYFAEQKRIQDLERDLEFYKAQCDELKKNQKFFVNMVTFTMIVIVCELLIVRFFPTLP